MKKLKTDLSVFKDLKCEKPPIGIKFLFEKPEGIEQLDGTMPLCGMIREAQQRETPFYATVENEDCAGKVALGWIDAPPGVEGGQMGAAFDVYQEPRANASIYQHAYKIARGTRNYVVFSPLDKVTFDPDLLMLTCDHDVAEIVLRAASYSTGEVWTSMMTPVLECSWLFAYPYLSGKVNYIPTGVGFGMRSKQVFPKGLVLLSIPYQKIPMITENLKEMTWDLPFYSMSIEEFTKAEQEIMINFGGM
jgi:uncharacterized protein (DUF169 family)